MAQQHLSKRVDEVRYDDCMLDLLFIQDATASQGPYIQSAKENILAICHLLIASGRLRKDEGLQVGLLAYRDYPQPKFRGHFVTKSYGFTYDLEKMKNDLAGLGAVGGGDGPEALSAALEEALTLDGWRMDSTKVIVVITDAPPHGLGERGDAFPNGAPEGCENPDPLELSREMLESGIVLLILACEPTLSKKYWYATDLYQAMSKITAGTMYPLSNPNLLSSFIIGSVLEKVELQELSFQYEEPVTRRYFVGNEPFETIVKDLNEEMRGARQKVTTVDMMTIYESSPESEHNAKVFATSKTLAEARKKLRRVPGSRFTPEYRASTGSAETPSSGFSLLKINVKNTGPNIIRMKTYDANAQKLREKDIVNNFTYTMEFKPNVPYNFVLQCGRKSKNFCRTFNTTTEDLDVESIYSSS